MVIVRKHVFRGRLLWAGLQDGKKNEKVSVNTFYSLGGYFRLFHNLIISKLAVYTNN